MIETESKDHLCPTIKRVLIKRWCSFAHAMGTGGRVGRRVQLARQVDAKFTSAKPTSVEALDRSLSFFVG